MKRLSCLLLALICSLAFIGSANAALIVVDFDDLPGDGTVADGYGGITWNGEWEYYDDVQPPYTPSSGTTRIYNSDRLNPSTFSFAAPVVFLGAYFSGLDSVAAPLDNPITYELYNGGNLVLTMSPSIFPSSTPTFLDSGYYGLIDEVHVISGMGDWYTMDDVTYSTGVPEPASLAMIGGAALSLVSLRFGRRHGKNVA